MPADLYQWRKKTVENVTHPIKYLPHRLPPQKIQTPSLIQKPILPIIIGNILALIPYNTSPKQNYAPFAPQVTIQAGMIEVGKVPHTREGFKVLEANKHAEAAGIVHKLRSRRIYKDPKMEVTEHCSFVTNGDCRDFAFASDILDGFGPWCGDLDEDVVLEDLFGFFVYLLVHKEQI